jgi:RNA polymerase sigma factor (sigma-70 family)
VNNRTDQELLRDYTEAGSEAAFSEVVRRHIDFVYSAALRLVRDSHLAQDVSQKVFLALAQNARRVAHRAVLSGWLHRTTHNLAANVVRSDARRRAREQEAAVMNELLSAEPETDWESIAPELDAALSELSEPDRDALLLRYFQRMSAQDMAQALGISGQAAQKRVNRAVERLRGSFAKRGIAVGASVLLVLIEANAVQTAPAGLAAAASGAALVGAALHTSTAITIAKIIAMTTLQKALLATTIVAVVGTGIYQVREVAHLRNQVQALQQREVPAAAPANSSQPELATAANSAEASPSIRSSRSRPATKRPSTVLATNPPALGPFRSSQLYALLTNKVAKLTLAQVEPYLNVKGRSAASLLAAFRTTSDPALLAEAIQKYPDDPQVGFEAAINNGASPAERRQGLDAFKQAAPENSLANYLSALDYLKSGQTNEALQELSAASGKPQFQDYSHDRVQTDEEAYLAAGYPPGEAQFIANSFLATPQLAQVKELGQNLIGLAALYQQAGDATSRDTALQMAVDLGQRLGDGSGGGALARQLVGINIERSALNVMDPSGAYGTAGQTVQNRIDQLAQQKEAIHGLTAQADPLWSTLSDQDWIVYHDQLAASGEEAALRWLVSNYGHK